MGVKEVLDEHYVQPAFGVCGCGELMGHGSHRDHLEQMLRKEYEMNMRGETDYVVKAS